MVDEFHEFEGRRWTILLGYILMAIAVAVAVVLLGRAAYRLATNSSAKVSAPTQTQRINKNQLARPSGASNTVVTPSPNQLSNTGPGDTAALFTISALTAGGIHYALKRRQSV
jgi:hypothetical protein